MAENPDHHIYTTNIHRDSWVYYIQALEFYERLLASDIAAAEGDRDLKAILDAGGAAAPLRDDLEHLRSTLDWMRTKASTSTSQISLWLDVPHRLVRLVLAATSLYMQHLEARRDEFGARPQVSRSVLEQVDARLAYFREKAKTGIFENATPLKLLAEPAKTVIPEDALAQLRPDFSAESPTDRIPTRPVVVGPIEILDPVLRSRCLDLFQRSVRIANLIDSTQLSQRPLEFSKIGFEEPAGPLTL